MALPLAARMISPPAGVVVVRVILESSMALALASDEWPLAWVRRTGLFGVAWLRALWMGRPSTLGSGTRSHLSWCQPRPGIQSPGLAAAAAAATRATVSSQERALGGS